VDHAFIACSPGAPEAGALLRLGFIEGQGNTHPGQGTANRRFFFENFMLELLWVADRRICALTCGPTCR
jgi:Glyoxalase-like domain